MNLVERLNICANDPMWCEHAEVPKSLLREAAAALEAAREDAANMATDAMLLRQDAERWRAQHQGTGDAD